MTSFLEQMIAGMANGSIYASVAIALVVTYKATRVINFAQGALATMTVYVAWSLMQRGLSYWPSIAISLLATFAFGTATELLFENPTEDLPVLNKIILTLGQLLIYESAMGWIYTYETKDFPTPFTGSPRVISGVTVTAQDLGVLTMSFAVMGLTFLFFRFTSLGIQMRAAAYDHEISRSLGIRVSRVLALGWGLSAVIGGIGGLLAAPSLFVSPTMMSGVMIYAIAAAITGGLESLAGAAISGLSLGVAENLVGTYVPFIGPSLKLTVALATTLLVLLFRPDGLFGKPEIERV